MPNQQAGPLAPGPGQSAAFAAYIDRFNAADIPGFTLYYASDVVFDLGVFPPMHGRPAVAAFYSPLFAVLRETLTVHRFVAEPDQISAAVTAVFRATAPAPDFVFGPLELGQTISVGFDVVYWLRDGYAATVTVRLVGAPESNDRVTSPPIPVE